MIIECVIVSKNYSDFLAHTIAENLTQVDRMVVVTHPDDKATQALCNKFGVDCLETEVMHDDGDSFNKGRAINLGLSHLRHEGWLMHLDADILLPHNFKKMLKHARLDEKCIYGADRLNVKSYEHWLENKHKTIPQHQWRYLVVPPTEFPIGARLLHQEYGWCPIGYTQIWHASTRRKYPIISGSAEHSDVLFAVQWARRNRILLPEFFVYHLESEPVAMGANWNGRKTKPFGQSPIEKKLPTYDGNGSKV
jgi:Glycosyl transferase family 2